MGDMGKVNKTDNRQSAAEDIERTLLGRARTELDRGCDSLDGHTCSRLTSIRHAALEQALDRGRQRHWLSWASLASACCLLVIILMSQHLLKPAAEPEVLEDLELFSSEVNLEFYEDLEFYQWLADNGAAV